MDSLIVVQLFVGALKFSFNTWTLLKFPPVAVKVKIESVQICEEADEITKDEGVELTVKSTILVSVHKPPVD